MATLLLSDLHLPNEPSPLREGFLRLLRGPARQAQALYLLGDVFEVWVGDDRGLADYAPEVEALSALRERSVQLRFMHGNRDFLVGRRFAERTGIELLADPLVVELEGVPTLISHGDLWCTDDLPYQRWRRFARNHAAQWLFLHLPQQQRLRIAGGVQNQSAAAKRGKSAEIMDVNATAIERAFAEHDVARMIHGHTHRPADHRLRIDGREVERVVLADWQPGRMEYLHVDAGRIERRRVD